MSKNKIMKAEGAFDYDFVNDILFFKVKDREYSHSVELSDYVIDFDTEGFIVGLQIFEASMKFNISKSCLREVKKWRLEATVRDNILEVNLLFNSVLRNMIIEKNPILIQRVEDDVPDSKILCTV